MFVDVEVLSHCGNDIRGQFGPEGRSTERFVC